MASERTTNAPSLPSSRVKLVVASSVMLTFISFWRAAAVVLNDLGSSAFYAGGIAEEAVGKSAPWFILGVMLFSFAVRAVYVESCSMFTRGGVYRVVKEALGGTFAKLSVSALMFDYILTGPISGVSAGQYITSLLNQLMTVAAAHSWLPGAMLGAHHMAPHLRVDFTSAAFAAIVTVYYWWQNLFLKYTSLPATLGLFGIIMAFGHSVLAMSGEETLAQVNREIEHPKLKNLKRAAIVIAIYSFLFTGIGSLLAVMLIPDSVRVPVYRDDLIAGLAMYMVGPQVLRIIFRVFVVLVGFLILSGAINTSIIGSTGVLMRIAEDGVLTDWFRKPHHKFGTSYRIVNLVAGMQLFTIVASRGNVIALGEAYAFGVIWSFTFNSLAMLVLRWKYKGERGWKVPPNLRIGKREIPIGLISVFMVLLTTALVNLFTKSVATVSGILFATTFFIIFTVSEHDNKRRRTTTELQMKEHFQLEHEDAVGREVLQIDPGCVVVTMRDANNPFALKWTLARTNTGDQDVVVLTARMVGAGGPLLLPASDQLFSEYEQMLFTKAVSVAESFGKHISLLVVPAGDIFAALVQTANSLEAAAVVSGLSSKMSAHEQAYRVGQAWEALPEPKKQITFYVVSPNGEAESFHIGPHAPSLRADDVELVHRLWLNFRRDPEMQNLHHSDIVTHALTRLAAEYARDKQETLLGLRRRVQDGNPAARLGETRNPVTQPGGDYAVRAPRPDDDEA